MKIDQDIERGLHPLIVQWFIAKAAKKGINQRQFAERIGITEIQLSRMKKGRGKQWRAVTPKTAQKCMEVLDSRAQHIQCVTGLLRDLQKRRSSRRHIHEKIGIRKLHARCAIVDEENSRVVLVDLRSVDHGDKGSVLVFINCDTQVVKYRRGKKISPHKAAALLLQQESGLETLFLKVFVTLQFVWIKRLLENPDLLDSDSYARLSRIRILRNEEGAERVLEKAIKVFEKHMYDPRQWGPKQ